MLPPEILKQYPGDGTFWYLIPSHTPEVDAANLNNHDWRAWTITGNQIGWLTMEEHIRLERIEPKLFQCAVNAGIALDASYIYVFPASVVRAFAENCSNTLNAPAVSHVNRWLDYVGYRVQWMLQTAASQNCGIYLDWD